MAPTFKDHLQAIINGSMTDREFERRMKDPLFRSWVKYMIKRANYGNCEPIGD